MVTLAAALVLVAPSVASAPATTSLQIQQNATFAVSPTDINVSVVVQCPAGTHEAVGVAVSQQQAVGPNTSGSGTSSVLCTGAKQTVVVLLSGGPFTTGSAFARATAATTELDFVPNPVDSRVITIS
jgi:hypothetical protein